MNKELLLLSVFDRVNGVFSLPRIFSDNMASNYRTITYIISQGRDEDFCMFLDDKDLFQVGVFVPETGEVIPDLKFLIRMKELKLDDKSNDSAE